MQDAAEPSLSMAASPVERAVRLAPVVAAAAQRIEQQRRIPDDVLSELHAARLFRLLLPREVGGEEVAPITFLRVLEEIGKADASTAWCICQTSVCSTSAVLLEPNVTLEIFRGPKALLAWGFGVGARAVECGDGYLVTGSWSFGSGSRNATWLGGPCGLYGPDGAPQVDAAGRPLNRMMLMPASSVTMVYGWDVMGLLGTGSDGYSVTDLFVPKSYALQFGAAPPKTCNALYLLPADSLWGGGFAAIALGLARAVLDALIALAIEKTPRGYKRPLAESAAVQGLVARSEARLHACRTYLYDIFESSFAEITTTRTVTMDQRIAIRLAASHAMAEAREVVDQCYHAAGTTAIFAANPFERRFRDMHMVTQHVHGRDSHFETVGQFLLGLEPEPAFW